MLQPKHGGRSEDSSDEDEPMATTQQPSKQPDGLSRAWMDADEDDEEEEDAEWSQLAVNATTQPLVTAPLVKKSERQRTPKFKRCLASIDKEQWNTDAWLMLMNEVQQLPIVEAREFYERLLSIFPTAGNWWKLFAEHELREKQYDRVQDIINKSLMQIRCPSVELWRFYLNFTKVVKLDVAVDSKDPNTIQSARQLMTEAYELALERVGASIYAAPIWQSYLGFLQEDSDPQAFLTVRKVFHRAVVMPLHNMDAIWKEYEKFERSIPNNEALAQNFFKVFRQKFDASRAVLRDRKKLFDAVNLNALATPPPTTSGFKQKEVYAQMHAWQQILAYEMQNPERLDGARFKARMRLALELFVSVMRQYPEAWHQYAAYENETNDPEAATSVFERALEAIPDSSLLSFAFADHYELRGNLAGAKAIYERLLKDHGSALTYITYQRFARRALGSKGLNEARGIFKRARKDQREGACTYHVFAAAALLEFYSDNSDAGKEVALKIFELGLKKFIQEPNYVLCYLDFLGHLNDDKNMRSLFEKVLAVMPVEKSRVIWDRYVDFEHTMVSDGGRLATVAKVEARRALAFPDAPYLEMKGLLSVTHRYSFLDLQPPSAQDQAFFNKYGVHSQRSIASSRFDAVVKQPENDRLANGTSAASASSSNQVSPEDMERLIPGPPLPDFLKEFALMLPLHLPWNGPIADVEHIYRSMLLVDFPPRSQIETLEQQQQQHQIQQQVAALQSQADKQTDDDGNSSIVSKRPAHDVFRSRQKQKLAKLA